MLKRLKVMLVGEGTEADPFRVNLPTYILDGEPDYERRWAWVLVPPDEVDKAGCIDAKKIREKYREGWAKFDAETVKPIDLGSLGHGFRPSVTQRIRHLFKGLKAISPKSHH